MNWLARREYGRKELARKLIAAGYESQAVEDALDGLVADGLQCDDRFAEIFVRHRADQAYGPRRIRSELRHRGVEAALVDHHLRTFEGDWFEVAERAWRRRYGGTAIDTLKEKARRFRHMGQRGFDHEHIDHAAHVCGESDEE